MKCKYSSSTSSSSSTALKDVLVVVEQSLDDQVLLHHVERQVVGRRCGPHERRAEDDGQVRDVHTVVLTVFRYLEQVTQEVLKRVVIVRRQALDDVTVLARPVRDGQDTRHLEGSLKELARDERLFELAEKELQAARQHVDVVLDLQNGPIVLIHLAADLLDLRKVATGPVDAVRLHVLRLALNQLDHLLDKLGHGRLIGRAEGRQVAAKDGLILPDALLDERLDCGTADKEPAQLVA